MSFEKYSLTERKKMLSNSKYSSFCMSEDGTNDDELNLISYILTDGSLGEYVPTIHIKQVRAVLRRKRDQYFENLTAIDCEIEELTKIIGDQK